MLGFVQNWLGPRANPIGVDFGTDALRLAQVQLAGNEYKLVAAATADVPPHVRHDVAARMNFFVETTRDLLAQGNFRGRQAVLALPAASMFIQHLRLPKTDEDTLKKSLPWEARGKLPIDPSHALLRHLIAGDVYQDQEPKQEVIVMAAHKELVNQFLAVAAKARLDVIGMNVEPKALLDCFAHVYRRKTDADVTNCFIDIGCAGTRTVIARGQQVLFARVIGVGGDHFTRAVAQQLGIGAEDAKLLRMKLAHLQPSLDEHREKQEIAPDAVAAKTEPEESMEQAFPLLGVALKARGAEDAKAQDTKTVAAELPQPAQVSSPARIVKGQLPDDPQQQLRLVEQACREPLNKLIEELAWCRRYHEATFPNIAVDRLIFVGGEARQRGLCQYIAREMGLAAQVGDPLVRMGRISEIGVESGIDRRQPQPGWAVAIGLSMGPQGVGTGGSSVASVKSEMK